MNKIGNYKNRHQSFDNNKIGMHLLKKNNLYPGKIIIFPHAGASSLAYLELADSILEIEAIYAITPPGHIFTDGECLNSIKELVIYYYNTIPIEILKNAILFGHSFGGYIAYEMACYLKSNDVPFNGLIISSSLPPDKSTGFKDSLSNTEVLSFLQENNVFDKTSQYLQDLNNPFTKVLLHDILLYKNYLPSVSLLLENIPVLIIGATEDNICPFYFLYGWQKWLKYFELHFIYGKHMYITKTNSNISKLIATYVKKTFKHEKT